MGAAHHPQRAPPIFPSESAKDGMEPASAAAEDGMEPAVPARRLSRLPSVGNLNPLTLGVRRKFTEDDAKLQRATALVQAHYRGHIVRRLGTSVPLTSDVRKQVWRVSNNQAGFCALLLYFCFCALTCSLLALQSSVGRTFEVYHSAKAHVNNVQDSIGTTWQQIGLSPDQIFDWTEALHRELHEDNEKFIVHLDKWAREDDGASGDWNASDFTDGIVPDGELGTKCDTADIPACCRFSAWRRGMAADDFERVKHVHAFGHSRVASPLFLKMKRRNKVDCNFATHNEFDPLKKVFVDCYSASEANTSDLFQPDSDEDDRRIWQEYYEEGEAFLMPIDLGLYKMPLDQGLCHIEKARRFGWIDTATSELDIEWARYNGHYELWTLSRLSLKWSLGGRADVDLEIISAPLRNLYSEAEDIARACFEGFYLLLLSHYVTHSIKGILKNGAWASFKSGWVLVDLTAHGLAITNVILWIKFAAESAAYRMPNFITDQGSHVTDSHTLWRKFLDNLVELETAEDDWKRFTNVQSVMLMFYILRLFRYLAFHQQFSLVTSTLIKASASLAHFLVVYVITLIMYAFVGYNLLGHRLENYVTMGASINSMCSLIVFDDTVSFQDIMEVAPGVGPLWYWSYFVLSSLLLINVLLAILLDSYAVVNAAARSANHIWTDAYVQWRLFRHYVTKDRQVYSDIQSAEKRVQKVANRRVRLSLAEVYQILNDMHLPSFVVWNVVLVLERKFHADAEAGALGKQLDDILTLERESHAQLRRTHALVVRHAGAGDSVKTTAEASE